MGSKALAGRYLRHDFFNESNATAHWLAGLIAADGSITADGNAWTLSQSGNDGRALIEHVRELIDHRLKLSETTPPSGRTAYAIYVPSVQMVSALQLRYGIKQRKTLTYRWPSLAGRNHMVQVPI